MTRCYEFYTFYLRKPRECELSRTGEFYVRKYIRLMQRLGVRFDGSNNDKELFKRF